MERSTDGGRAGGWAVRLTSLGRGVVAAGLVAAIGGAALGAAAVVAVGVFLLALVGLAMLLVADVPEVQLARSARPVDVERGAPSSVRLTFRSTSTRRARRLTVIEEVDGHSRVGMIGPIDPQGTEQLTYAIDTSQRGLVTAGPITVCRFDPFGLVIAERRFASTCTVSVRPRCYPIRMLPSGRQRDLDGPTQERSEGSATFHQLRSYVPGDDLRRVHWASTARTGELLVKQMIDTTRPEVVVVLDNRADAMTAADFEQAVDIAASIVVGAEAEDFPTLLVFVDEVPNGAGRNPSIASIDRLTSVEQGSGDSLAQLAEGLASRGRSLVLITGEPSTADLTMFTKLARGFSPAYLVSVVSERRVPVVAPRGMRAVACVDGADFAALWATLR